MGEAPGPHEYHRSTVENLPLLYRMAAEEMEREGLIKVIEDP